MQIEWLYVLLILIGALGLSLPVFYALMLAGTVGYLFLSADPSGGDLTAQAINMARTFFKSMDNFNLVVVLFFVLCGNIMTSGSIVKKLMPSACSNP